MTPGHFGTRRRRHAPRVPRGPRARMREDTGGCGGQEPVVTPPGSLPAPCARGAARGVGSGGAKPPHRPGPDPAGSGRPLRNCVHAVARAEGRVRFPRRSGEWVRRSGEGTAGDARVVGHPYRPEAIRRPRPGPTRRSSHGVRRPACTPHPGFVPLACVVGHREGSRIRHRAGGSSSRRGWACAPRGRRPARGHGTGGPPRGPSAGPASRGLRDPGCSGTGARRGRIVGACASRPQGVTRADELPSRPGRG